MDHEFFKDQLQVTLAERDQVVEAFSANGADESLAKRVRLWRSNGSFEHSHAEAFQRSIHTGRENAVTVTDQESLGVIKGEKFTELLGCPVGSRVLNSRGKRTAGENGTVDSFTALGRESRRVDGRDLELGTITDASAVKDWCSTTAERLTMPS